MPRRPSRPRIEPRIMGASRLDLEKPVDSPGGMGMSAVWRVAVAVVEVGRWVDVAKAEVVDVGLIRGR
jgi:hypothetical protein